MKGRAVGWPLVVIWAVVLLLDLLAAVGLSRLRYDDGLQDAFRSSNAWYDEYRRYSSQFVQSDADVAVLFHSADFADPVNLERVSDFALEARLLGGVSDTASIFALRGPPDPQGRTEPLLPAMFPDRTELGGLLDVLRDDGNGGARLLSADRTLTAVVVALADGGSDLAAVRQTLAEIDDLARSSVAGTQLSFEVTGIPPMRTEVVDGLYGDLVMLNVIGIVAGLLVCFAALRDLPLALLTTMPSGTALLWSLGALGALDYPINVVSVALPVLILVLSFADSLHLTFEVRRLTRMGEPADRAVEAAIRRVGPACALTSLTTAIAFGGLLLSQSVIVRDLGIAGVVATIVSLAAVLVAHPMLFATVARMTGASVIAGAERTPSAMFDWSFLPEMALRRPVHVAVGAAFALVASASIYPSIEPTYAAMENISTRDPVFRAFEEMERELQPGGVIDVPVALSSSAGATGESSLSRIEAVHRVAARAVADGPVYSLATLAGRMEGVSAADRASRLALLLDQMSAHQRGRLVSADGGTALVRIGTTEADARAVRNLVGRLETAFGEDPEVHRALAGRPTGFLAMSSFVSEVMIADLNKCFLLAVIVSGLLTILWFRNIRYGLVALVPNVLPIALVGAWLVLSGRGLQFSSGVALTIAFGVAVDDTVHVLNRLRLNAPPGSPFDPDAIRRSMREVTPVLVVTTAVLSFGLLGTFVSSVPTVAYFGALSIAVFFLAILADLVVLPACLVLLGPAPLRRRLGRIA